MNTVKITKTAEGRARVTVVSEGERDLSAVVEAADLLAQVSAAFDEAEAPAGTEPLTQD